ncbi:MAG: hypothetical protein HC841_07830 [Verrucomicrobiae bacterium]|nr:hypothetical protein [Verrucomicrobiae bacterium]
MKHPILLLLPVLFVAFTVSAAEAPAKKKAAARPAAPLPENVEKRAVVIWSDGTRMAGDLYLPKDRKPEDKFPAIVLCAGTGGTKGGTQARLAPIFASKGYVALAFDYRGWGVSESQLMAVGPQPKPDAKNELTIPVKALRWQMNYTDQTEDIRAAISFVAGEPGVDRIGAPEHLAGDTAMADIHHGRGPGLAGGTHDLDCHFVRNVHHVDEDMFSLLEAAGIIDEQGSQFGVTGVGHS